jgi:hypothetical protein
MAQRYFVPGRCVPERKVSDVSSLGQCVSNMMCPLDDASLDDAFLGRCVIG